MSVPCPTCLPLDCSSLEDSDLYSIESPIFGFVLDCPEGYDCGTATGINMVCCGQVLSAQFPLNATVDDKLAIIQELVNQCGVRQLFCGGPTTQLFFNRTKTCTVRCPDGSPFVYTVAAGTFLGPDQATVDQQAADFACVQAGLRKVCLGNLQACTCVGLAYSSTIPTSGGIGPFTWSLFGGALPTGLSLDQTGTISGVPTVNGTYSFNIRLVEPDGSYTQRTYAITCLEITTTQLDSYSVGVPYSFQLHAAGGSGQYAWKITAGTLPPGLVMDINGLITGTPS